MECFADGYDLLPLIYTHLQRLEEGVGYPLKSLLWPWLSGQRDEKDSEDRDKDNSIQRETADTLFYSLERESVPKLLTGVVCIRNSPFFFA